MMKTFLVALLFLGSIGAAYAIEPGEQLKDPALEARARALGQELRCLVCENESIDASQAPLAADLRQLVRQRILAGDNDAQIRTLLADRYGEYVLFRPRFDARNALLWLGPFALLVIAGTVLLIRARKRVPTLEQDLSDSEELEVASLLADSSNASQRERADTDPQSMSVTKN